MPSLRAQRSNLFIITILVFIACLSVGFWIARHKPIWNDEYYSQVSSVQGTSYSDQFSGHIAEGGNAPLFYSLQKAFLQIIHYHTPTQWLQGHWKNDTSSQILLRINPIIFISLSMAMVFYYFCRKYSLWTGFLSLFIYSSSYMLWVYWAEARPYALLVFLTTLQSLVLLYKMDQNPRREGDRLWLILAGTNILLSLTSILSLGEILAVSVLWWAFNERDWKKYIVVTLLPVIMVIFYYMHAPQYQFSFGLSPEQLIRDNISRQRFDIVFIFLISLAVYWWGRKSRMILSEKILEPIPYVIFMALVLASSAAVLYIFALHAQPVGQGFPITSRYFIYLTPIGVIATTSLSVTLIKSFNKYHLIQWGLASLIGILFIQQFLKIVPKAIHSLLG